VGAVVSSIIAWRQQLEEAAGAGAGVIVTAIAPRQRQLEAADGVSA
jgi:hypothetical protein